MADHNTLINQAQTSATPLITFHLEELPRIHHHFKGDLMIRCIPHVFHDSIFLEALGIAQCSCPNTQPWYDKDFSTMENNVVSYSVRKQFQRWQVYNNYYFHQNLKLHYLIY